MFRDEKVYIIEVVDRCIKLQTVDGKPLALIFIKGDKLIIRTEGEVEESSIKAPSINIL